MDRCLGAFRAATDLPCYGVALPEHLEGMTISGHASFWRCGYPALMVTATAPFRDPHYHTLYDTLDKLDYDRLAKAVTGLAATLRALAGSHPVAVP